MRVLSVLALALAVAACESPREPAPLSTPADSLAARLVAASGGWDTWNSLDRLRFDWVVERDTGAGPVPVFTRHHLWGRIENRHRVEWAIAPDSTVVVVLDLDRSTDQAPVGHAWIGGQAAPDSLVVDGYEAMINDLYWLAAPIKVLDPGVDRALALDSAREGEDVLALSFRGVGLTPGDRYWFGIDKDTGHLRRWTYLLEGSETTTTWAWTDLQEVETSAGPLVLPVRKSKADGSAIVTPLLSPPTDLDWDSPTPILSLHAPG